MLLKGCFAFSRVSFYPPTREPPTVVAASLLDKETAQLEAMRAAALKTSLEQQKHGAPYSGGVGRAFADEQPRDASASPVATKPGER